LDFNNDFLVGLTACLLVFSIITYALNFVAVFVAGNVKIKAPVARLLGPVHQNDSSIDSVIMFKTHAFRLYTLGMLCFFGTAILNMLRKPIVVAIPVIVIIASVAITFLYYAYDIRKRFDLPENRLTTGKVYFFQSKTAPVKVSVEPSPESISPKNQKKTAIQHFCIDCGAPYKSVAQQFCESCGGECERVFSSKKVGLSEIAEEEAKGHHEDKRARAKKGRVEPGEEAELTSLV
jgi:hypothetical protein